jgi:uroporphyrinogen decarboxylase
MKGKAKIDAIFKRTNTGTPGYWTGNPHPETLKRYTAELGIADAEALYSYLGDDSRWLPADRGYRHPEGRPMLDPLGGKPRESLSQPGVFADCESVAVVDAYPWPDVRYLDFGGVIEDMRRKSDKAIWTGMWSPFYHDVADFFGMDNYFMAMYTRPEIVDAVTDRIVSFYEQADELFFAAAGDLPDTLFFGNDFGTQLDLMISPEAFDRFVMPGMRRLIAIGKRYGKTVLLHSCGSIYRVIPTLIEAGVDALHPIQALARNMDAETLAREFGKDLAFVGGVDTQQLLVRGTPEEIRGEVLRLRDVFGPNYVVSPSHEAILPNVPLANVEAMARAARE